MNLVKHLKMIIRGWLPKEPLWGSLQKTGAKTREENNVPIKPDYALTLVRRAQLTCGISIGLGLALILVGFLGWLTEYFTYGALQNFFVAGGLDPKDYYLFSNLTDQMANFLTIILCGMAALLIGALALKNHAHWEFLFGKNKHWHLSGGLIGAGGALALGSTHTLFLYILARSYIYSSLPSFELFTVPFSIGILILGCSILVLRLK